MDSPFEARWQVPPGDPTACRWHLSKAASNWPSMDGGVESGGGAARQVLGEVVARSWRGRGEDGGPDLGRRRRQGSGVEEASRSCVSGGETECGRRRDNVVAVVGSGATGARVTNERCRRRKKKKVGQPKQRATKLGRWGRGGEIWKPYQNDSPFGRRVGDQFLHTEQMWCLDTFSHMTKTPKSKYNA
jgi:hypothetical protein